MLSSESSVNQIAVAFHEAGHAVAAHNLGLGFLLKTVRVAPDAEGRGPGVDLSGDAVWRGCPAIQKPDDVSDEEWLVLKNSPEKWNDWIERDHDKFAIYYLAGEAAQRQHAPNGLNVDHKTDDSHVQRLVPSERVPQLKKEADLLIAENWSGVELVASELIRSGRLTGTEVTKLLNRDGRLR
jgi:hypothetical protein